MFDQIYYFYGKHAKMVVQLTSPLFKNETDKNKEIKSIFNTNYDVYAIAPLVGYLFDRRAKVDKSDGMDTRIFRDKMMDEAENLKYNYRLLMLLMNKDKSEEEIKKVVFLLDNNDEERKSYDEIYDDFVRGGVEVLYEHIFNDASSYDEYLMNLYEFLEDFNNRYFAEIEDVL